MSLPPRNSGNMRNGCRRAFLPHQRPFRYEVSLAAPFRIAPLYNLTHAIAHVITPHTRIWGLLDVTFSETISRRKAALCIVFAALFSVAWDTWLGYAKNGGTIGDFRAIYFAARTRIDHHDPYKVDEFLQVYRQEGQTIPAEPLRRLGFSRSVPICVNPPSTLLVVAPLALFSWGPAHLLWMILTPAGLALAAWLLWDLAGARAPAFTLALLCFVLANIQGLLRSGNSSGLAVSLSIVGVWCLFKHRYEWAGILGFALGLALKPMEAGLIWLFFLLAGGTYRRRAWQISAIAVSLLALGTLWVAQVSPHWYQEWRANIAATSAHGDLNDPGPTSFANRGVGMIVSLQSIFSILRDDPQVYNPAAYLLGGSLLLIWCIVTFRSRLTEEGNWLALASVAALSMLPVYHRQYDTQLILLAIPACAILWAREDRISKSVAACSAMGIVLTSDFPSAMLMVTGKGLHLSLDHLAGKLATIFMLRSATVGLLMIGVLCLWAFIRQTSADEAHAKTFSALAFAPEATASARTASLRPTQKASLPPRKVGSNLYLTNSGKFSS